MGDEVIEYLKRIETKLDGIQDRLDILEHDVANIKRTNSRVDRSITFAKTVYSSIQQPVSRMLGYFSNQSQLPQLEDSSNQEI